MYDGTLESLENKSNILKTPYPNSHTLDDLKHIKDLIKRNPYIGLNEFYGKLRHNYAYSRTFYVLYKFLKKNVFNELKKKKEKYNSQKILELLMLSEKMQLDVKVEINNIIF